MTKTEAQAKKLEGAHEQPPSSTRKRRRRAPATGAADDCFTCQELRRKCDRKRPYCTQCLDHGKDCSGYKTALTWNVGVASRGKLRGLSLPIAKSKKVEQDPEQKSTKKKSASSETTQPSSSRRSSQLAPTSQPFNAMDEVGTTRYSFITVDPHSSTTSPMLPPPNLVWPSPFPHSPHRSEARLQKRVRRHSLRPLRVPAYHAVRSFEGLPMSAHALGGYTNHEFEGSVECSPTVSSFAGFEPTYKDCAATAILSNPFESYFFDGHETVGWPRDNMSSSFSSGRSSGDYPDDETFYADPIVASTLDDILSTQHALNHHDLVIDGFGGSTDDTDNVKFRIQGPSSSLVTDDCGAHPRLNFPRSLPSVVAGKTSSLQGLIDYYDKVISPVIVAFDSPSTHYRSHILRLAVESETLQHAIAALSANNIRQRRACHTPSSNRSRTGMATSPHGRSIRRSSMAYTVINTGLGHFSQVNPEEPSVEELYHKGASIKSLNEELAEPSRRMDDSILATLLILCLYHVSDTGVAKFKTRFLGVKKILSFRGCMSGTISKATTWLTILFTWFDELTATMNSRDGPLRSNDINMSIGDGDVWALKNLVGCDAQLFQILSKLGRLNLLNQNRPVQDAFSGAPNAKIGPLSIPTPKTQDYYSMNYQRFDGNGWSNLHDLEVALDETETPAQFWTEWSDIRKKLRDWQLPTPMSTLTGSDTGKGSQVDLANISESFRYSALLYTERLAFPHLPSAHPNFQNLVNQALHHIGNVESDVFLLWPLFISSAGCVTEQRRLLIRQRCLEVQKDSEVFNSISCLDLLQKAWQDDGVADCEDDFGSVLDESTGMNMGWHGSRWGKGIERVDGEYIAV